MLGSWTKEVCAYYQLIIRVIPCSAYFGTYNLLANKANRLQGILLGVCWALQVGSVVQQRWNQLRPHIPRKLRLCNSRYRLRHRRTYCLSGRAERTKQLQGDMGFIAALTLIQLLQK